MSDTNTSMWPFPDRIDEMTLLPHDHIHEDDYEGEIRHWPSIDMIRVPSMLAYSPRNGHTKTFTEGVAEYVRNYTGQHVHVPEEKIRTEHTMHRILGDDSEMDHYDNDLYHIFRGV